MTAYFRNFALSTLFSIPNISVVLFTLLCVARYDTAGLGTIALKLGIIQFYFSITEFGASTFKASGHNFDKSTLFFIVRGRLVIATYANLFSAIAFAFGILNLHELVLLLLISLLGLSQSSSIIWYSSSSKKLAWTGCLMEAILPFIVFINSDIEENLYLFFIVKYLIATLFFILYMAFKSSDQPFVNYSELGFGWPNFKLALFSASSGWLELLFASIVGIQIGTYKLAQTLGSVTTFFTNFLKTVYISVVSERKSNNRTLRFAAISLAVSLALIQGGILFLMNSLTYMEILIIMAPAISLIGILENSRLICLRLTPYLAKVAMASFFLYSCLLLFSILGLNPSFAPVAAALLGVYLQNRRLRGTNLEA
jgi:hypothetical protein